MLRKFKKMALMTQSPHRKIGCSWNKFIFRFKMNINTLDRDLSYGEILAGRPGAWPVKKIFFYMHAIKKVKKETYILMFVMRTPTLKK